MTELPNPPTEIVRTSRGEVAVARAGSGPPVLVVHGTPGGVDCAVTMSRFLVDAGFEAIAPARPGYPGTPLESGRTIDEQADLHEALLDALGIERASVLAWSGGGPSSYRLAVNHPERVGALVVFAGVSGHYVSPHLDAASRFALNTAPGNALLRTLARRAPRSAISGTLAAEGELSKQELKRQVGCVMSDDEQREFVLVMTRIAGDARHRRFGIDNDREGFGSIENLELERIATPTLLIHGDADTDVAPIHSKRAAELIPDAEHAEIVCGTHFALFAHPEAAEAQARAVEVLRGAS
jgi:pimeloyl-ACP methyl ester carboxylesterase